MKDKRKGKAKQDALRTAEQAGKFLGVTEKTLWRWRSRGLGPKFLRLGALGVYIRYRLADLEAFREASVREFDPATASAEERVTPHKPRKRTRKRKQAPAPEPEAAPAVEVSQ